MKTRERKTGKVVGLSILCFILTLLLGGGLLLSLCMRHAVQERVVTAAVEKLPLEEISMNDESLAQYILDEFIQDERVSVENVKTVMRDGTFSAYMAELTEKYNAYLTEGGEFPSLQAEDFVQLITDNEALIAEETGLAFLEPDKQKLRENAAPLAAQWNRMDQGIPRFAVKSAVSVWLQAVLGLLLIAVLVWMIVFYVRGGFRSGTALKVFSIALFIPNLCLFVMLVLADAFGGAFLQESRGLLYGSFLPFAGGGALISVLIFCTGVIISRRTAKPALTDAAEGMLETAEEKTAELVEMLEQNATGIKEELVQAEEECSDKRQFCRNCGQPLVNPDAKFCYKCGNVQEHVNTEK